MPQCFEGLTVLDFCNNIAGPTAAAMMADYGARVIKIEKPSGDDSRKYAPKLKHRSISELWFNRGKESVTVDMNDPEGISFLKKLIAKADVVIEAFRPGTMKKFGLDYETLHAEYPRLIYCSISAFGQHGPMAKVGGYDTVIQAMSGMMEMTGEPDGEPVKLGFPVVDYATAHNMFGGISMALYHRERAGQGQWVSVSLFSVATAMDHFLEQTAAGIHVSRNGNISKVVAPVGNYTGKHGTLCISCNNDKLWVLCAKAMGREDLITDPDFATNVARGKNTYKVKQLVIDWMNTFDDIDTPDQILQEAGVPCHKVNTLEEALELAEKAGDGAVAEMKLVEGLGMETLKARAIHIVLSETPGKLSPSSHELGADTIEVLKANGYSEEQAKTLAGHWTAK